MMKKIQFFSIAMIVAVLAAQPALANPTISSVSNTGAVEGGSTSVTVTATGNGTLSYSFDCDGNGSFGDAGDVGPQAGDTAACGPFVDNGTATVNVRVTDDDGDTDDSTLVTITNLDPTVNAAAADPVVVDEGDTANNSGSFDDVPADTITITADFGTLVDNGDGSWSWSFVSTDDIASQTVNVTATDDDGGSVVDSFTLTVNNLDPTVDVAAADPVVVDEGDTANNSGSFDDVPADTITITADFGTLVDNGDGSWSWSFASTDDIAAQAVNVTATDDDGGSVVDSFTLTVNNADPSVAADNDPIVVNEGDPAANTGTFSDAGDDTVTITVSAGAGSVSQVGTQSGTWSWSFGTSDGPDESQTITIQADDGEGGVSTVDFTLTVNNVAPTATDNSYSAVEDGGTSGNVITDDTGSGVDSDPGADTLTVVAFDNPSANGGTVSVAGNGDFTYTVAPDFCGLDTFDYTIDDDEGATSTATVTVDVTCVNDQPTFDPVSDPPAINEDAGAQTVAGFATGMSAGPANESGQVLTFNITGNDAPAKFASGPSIDATTGDLTYEILPDRAGTATIQITLSDDGGTANGGVDTSDAQSFTITINPINDPPTFALNEDVCLGPAPCVVTQEKGTGTQTVPNVAVDISPGPPNESAQSVSFVVVSSVCMPADLLDAGPVMGSGGTLGYDPKDNSTGTCDITVKLTDSGPGAPPPNDNESGALSFVLSLVDQSLPIANPDQVFTSGSDPLTIVLTGSDPDEQYPLSFQVLEPDPDGFTCSLDGDNCDVDADCEDGANTVAQGDTCSVPDPGTGPFYGSLDTFTPSTNGDGVSADVVYTPDGPFITSAALVANQSILLKNNSEVLSGDVVINDAGGYLDVRNNAATPAGFEVKSDVMDVANNADIDGDAFCNSGDYSANCDPLAVPAFDPVADPLPPFLIGDVGTDDFSVGKNKTENITPGLYRDIDIGQKGTLVFAPGKYSVRSITTSNKAVLEFGGATEIKVAETMDIGNTSTIGAAGFAADVIFYVAGTDGGSKAVELRGNNTETYANIYAPNGTIKFGQNTDSTGAFFADHIEVLNNATINLASGFSERSDQLLFEVTDQAGLTSDSALVEINPDGFCRDGSGEIAAIAAFAGSADTNGAASISIALAGCEANDSPVTFDLVQDGSFGAVSGLPSGPAGPPYSVNVTYTPTDDLVNEKDDFIFSISNGVSTVQATVEINDPPCDVRTATPVFGATDEGNPLALLLEVCDPDDVEFAAVDFTTGAISGCASCAVGAAVLEADYRPGFSSATVTFTHNEPTPGTTATFNYTVGGVSAPVTVEVNGVNEPPVAGNDFFEVLDGGNLVANVLGNDTDPNGDPLTAVLAGAGPVNGTVLMNANGTFSYDHDGTGTSDSFQYQAVDDDGELSNLATVSISVNGIPTIVNVTIAGTGTGTVTSSPAGISCPGTCSTTFVTAETVLLEAIADAGSQFDGDLQWTGDADCADGALEAMGGTINCTANFELDAALTPGTVDVTMTAAGDGSGTVLSTQAGASGINFSACPTCPSQTFTVDNFQPEDPRIFLVPIPDANSDFAGFSAGPGCPGSPSDPPDCGCSDRVLDGVSQVVGGTATANCTATFNLKPVFATLEIVVVGAAADDEVTVAGFGHCAPSSSPCQFSVPDGATVDLNAVASTSQRGIGGGSVFSSWSGDCGGTNKFTSVTVNDGPGSPDASCTATFSATP